MKPIITHIFKTAITAIYGESIQDCDPTIQIAKAPFGDYQANFAMRLAKQLQLKPHDVATKVVARLKNNPIFKSLEVSGPGFINIKLAENFIAENLQKLISDERLGVLVAEKTETIVVDYANANVAKEMHVGHIRSIVIGDAIVRILSFLGHFVIRQSHLGDWGTQFGMLIEYLLELGTEISTHTVSDLDPLYKKSKIRFDSDPGFADKARHRVVKLQSGDVETLEIWQQLVKQSLSYFQNIYENLDVLITEEDARGESFYNDMLFDTVEELKKLGLATKDDGALVIFLENFKGSTGEPFPFIIRKKDGGYLYATTDLAAAKFRINELGATRIIYLTDARQKQHFAMLFATLRLAGWANENIRLEHIPFGAILGQDNKPIKTRTGESIKLIDLLTEAEIRAKQITQQKNISLSPEELNVIAHQVGIGALKYADMRADKVKDYVFDWDKLLSFEGNTAPYLQNAYVRIQSLFKKGQIDLSQIKNQAFILNETIERELALKILSFSEIIYSIAEDLSLHRLCDYLYELAASFHRFYEHCPILTATDDSIKNSRLLIAHLSARVLKLGLNLLGISTPEKM